MEAYNLAAVLLICLICTNVIMCASNVSIWLMLVRCHIFNPNTRYTCMALTLFLMRKQPKLFNFLVVNVVVCGGWCCRVISMLNPTTDKVSYYF